MRKLKIIMGALMIFTNSGELKKQSSEDPESIQEGLDSLSTEKTATMTRSDHIPYFKATGTEPFWGVKIHGDRIVLTSPGDSIVMPHPEPIRVADSNIKMYRSQVDGASMDVIITQKKCINAMSGEEFPYQTTISYKENGTEEAQILEGCGEYITDHRLNDIWVLEEMEGKKVDREKDFNGSDLPYMELYTNENRFSGFSGCNRMTGSLYFEWDVLRFGQVASTRMACPNMEQEGKFLEALQSVTQYAMENNRLYLSNAGNAPFLVFKKID